MSCTVRENLFTFVVVALFGTFFTLPTLAQDTESDAFDGLVAVEGAKADILAIDPEADFSVYQRIIILDPYVAFIKNWRRDVNRDTRSASSRVSNSDMEKIKVDVAAMFKEVFTEKLQADDGFVITDETGDDVLIIRPAIIDLDITAPDTMSPGRSRTYVATAGAATIYVELFDSVSGAIIGRAADRRTARQNRGRVSWSTGVTNAREARRMMGIWADQLKSFLEDHYPIGAQQ